MLWSDQQNFVLLSFINIGQRGTMDYKQLHLHLVARLAVRLVVKREKLTERTFHLFVSHHSFYDWNIFEPNYVLEILP